MLRNRLLCWCGRKVCSRPVSFVVIFIVLLFLLDAKLSMDEAEPRPNPQLSRKSRAVLNLDEYKTILLWTSLYHMKNWWQDGTEGFMNCPEKRCSVTSDRALLQRSQALVVHPYDLRLPGALDLPSSKPDGQTWIFRTQESPVHIYLGQKNYTDLRVLDGWFDLVMTYKQNADISDVYGWYRSKVGFHDDLPVDHIEHRSKLAVWFATNCNLSESSKVRMSLIKRLQKHIPVDIYGKCGNKDPCEKYLKKPALWWTCARTLKRKYKFYLAFENSRCKDYITEKFWWALYQGIVPVVVGPDISNYETVAPPNSFIHADEFSNVKELARYLYNLDKNPADYSKYFEWRKTYEIMIGPPVQPWCQLCELLHRNKSLADRKLILSKYFDKHQDCQSEYSSRGLSEH